MRKNHTTFYCFSPPVMAATFIIEFSLMAYTLIRYKLTPLARIAGITLFLLGLFQLSEFTVCGATSFSVNLWSRIGFAAITMLPPLGLHLIRELTKRVPLWAVGSGYAVGAAFAIVFSLSANAFQGHVCAGNYAIFQLAPYLGGAYFAYYYGLLIIGIVLSLYFSVGATITIRKALVYQVFGYLSFLLPTGIVNAVNPQTIAGIPSVMCGFAVIYAIVLAFGIVPLTLKKR